MGVGGGEVEEEVGGCSGTGAGLGPRCSGPQPQICTYSLGDLGPEHGGVLVPTACQSYSSFVIRD